MSEPNKDEAAPPRRKKKKSKGHAGHHGGAWKVAFADFMTAMMALFLVLWLVSQADTKLKQAIASYFRSPGVFDTMKGGILSQAKKVSKEPTSLTSKDDEQVLFSVAQKLDKSISSRPELSKFKDRVKIQVTEEGLKIELVDKAEQVSFPSGSSVIAPEAKVILEEIAKELCELPNKINIGGHTDSRVFASDNDYGNWELSTDRANAARRILESICVKPEQINRIVGYADTEPIDQNDKYAPANRRISIMVLRLPVSNDETDTSAEDEKLTRQIGKNVVEKSEETVSENKKAVKTPLVKETEKTNSENDKPENSEKKEAKAKLLNEGVVKVGEADEIPDKPKIKQ